MRSLSAIQKHMGVVTIETGVDGGAFVLRTDTANLRIVASWGGGWDHVSVSTRTRVPRYYEMRAVKRVFFKPEEWAMELHAPLSLHINFSPKVLHLWRPHVLHLWRPQSGDIPVPPRMFV